MAERPRWLVYEADSGSSFNTLLEIEGAARVEFVNGKVVWFDPRDCRAVRRAADGADSNRNAPAKTGRTRVQSIGGLYAYTGQSSELSG
jgi:hypothetical protein